MADPASYGNPVRDIDQALIALKKGTQLIKYSRKGKPKFCPFRLSPDETTLIWYSHGAERNLKLSSVSRIIPGQRTPVFKRYLRPEKEYLSFSLIYNNGERSLDLICKDKVESEAWLAGLKALISTGQPRSRRAQSDISDLYGFGDFAQDSRSTGAPLEFTSSPFGSRISADFNYHDYPLNFTSSDAGSECANMQIRTSSADGFRISVSSAPSCSSQGSGPDDIESLGDVFVWGEIWSDGGARDGNGCPIPLKTDVLAPRPLESNVVLDVLQIACGVRHVALVTRQGEVFTWGEESGGRLGHGIEKDFCRPRLVEFLAVTNVDFVACGEFHTCAVSSTGDLYTWGDGTHAGLLGHGNDVSHWLPKRVSGPLEGLQVFQIACGTWHSALVTTTGRLFTFGDGSFGALGHGDRETITCPKEIQSLSGLKTISVACGVWHTAAIIEVTNQSGSNVLSRKLFTWGDGDKNRLGHGNKETYLLPTCVSALIDYNIHQLACGHNITVALTTSGHVFTMGSNAYGQLGNPQSDGKSPVLVQDKLVGEFVEQIACGAHHVAALTSRSEMFTWGKGANGRLGHGDTNNCDVPTLVEALKDRHIKYIACGSSYTASICIHKWVSGADQSVCTGCRQAFGFTRKRHNCYNCGLVHCHGCSSKKALRAALAPTPGKPHRVCDPCYAKLKKNAEPGNLGTINRRMSSPHRPLDYSSRVERVDARASRILLSPSTEPVKYLEVKSGKTGNKNDSYSIVRASQVPSLLQLKDIAFPSSFSAIQYAFNPGMTSTPPPPPQPTTPPPQSQSNSRPASPYRRPSPPRTGAPVMSRGVIDSLKKTNDLLNQEVSKLQNQVKSLKQKSEIQDTEILKLKKSAQEAASLAEERSSKYKIAIQAIKTIRSQLRDITENMPPDFYESESFKEMQIQIESFLNAARPQTLEDNSAMPPESSLANHKNDAGVQDMPQSADGTPQESNGSSASDTKGVNHHITTVGVSGTSEAARSDGRKEVIEQFEPGVYVTVIQLADGTKIFKRVRFSKRRFAEQQAEEWWKENKDRLLKKYSPPPKVNGVPAEVTAVQPPTEENNPAAQSA